MSSRFGWRLRLRKYSEDRRRQLTLTSGLHRVHIPTKACVYAHIYTHAHTAHTKWSYSSARAQVYNPISPLLLSYNSVITNQVKQFHPISSLEYRLYFSNWASMPFPGLTKSQNFQRKEVLNAKTTSHFSFLSSFPVVSPSLRLGPTLSLLNHYNRRDTRSGNRRRRGETAIRRWQCLIRSHRV